MGRRGDSTTPADLSVKRATRLRRGLAVSVAAVLVAGLLIAAQASHDDPEGAEVTSRREARGPRLAEEALTAPGAAPAGDGAQAPTDQSVAVGGATRQSSGQAGRAPADSGSVARPATSSTSTTPGLARGGRLQVGPGVHGVTDTTIQLGMAYADATATAGAVNATTGNQFSGPTGFDWEKTLSTAVDLVNSQGGIAGRKVEPVVFYYKVQNWFAPSGRQQEAQAACEHWTKDNQVFSFDAFGFSDDAMVECAVKSKTPLADPKLNAYPSERVFASIADYWYSPNYFVADRRERSMARFLLTHAFFDGEAKVAVMIENKPGIREGVARGLEPILSGAGIKPTAKIVYPDHIESPWANYVLQLQAAGVTHIVWAATTGPAFAQLSMMRAAENQRYRPKWALGSDNWPNLLADLGAPADQLANTSGMGWNPIVDTGNTDPPSTPAQVCDDAMKQNGQPVSSAARQYCEYLFFLQAGFVRATVVSPAGLAEGVSRLGDSYQSTVTIDGATRFGPNRHDGVAIVRRFAYDAAQKQFNYVTEPEPVPDQAVSR